MNKIKAVTNIPLPKNNLIGNISLHTKGLKEMLRHGLNWVKVDIHMLRSGKIRLVDNLHNLLQLQKNIECTIIINVHTSLQEPVTCANMFFDFIKLYDSKSILIASLDYSFLCNLKNLAPKLPICWQIKEYNELTLAIAKNKKFQAIYYSGNKITEQFITTMHKSQIWLLVTTKSATVANKCRSLGAFVCTDNPKLLLNCNATQVTY